MDNTINIDRIGMYSAIFIYVKKEIKKYKTILVGVFVDIYYYY